MATRRAILNTADLRKMAKVVREEGVNLNGNLDPLGNFQFSLTPFTENLANDPADDLDERLARFAKR